MIHTVSNQRLNVSDVIKSKVRQLYSFLKEANQLRFRPVRLLSEQPKVIRLGEMPNHPSMQIFRPIQAVDNAQEIPDALLRIKRPHLTSCPMPPATINSWLLPNWDDPSKDVFFAESQNKVITEDFTEDPARIDEYNDWLEELNYKEPLEYIAPPDSITSWLADGWDLPDTVPQVLETRERTVTIRFDDDEQRVANYRAWLTQRQEWVDPELLARRAMSFFERFYDIYAALEKDGEDLELLVADGHFIWLATSELDGPVRISHPILLKRVELRFDPKIPEFSVHESDREPELYGSLFVDLQDISPIAIKNRSSELELSGYHPLGWDDTEAFLKAFIQTVAPIAGEYLDELPIDGVSTTPRIYRDMVLMLRKRTSGIANAVNLIIEDIDHQEVFASSLAQITGTIDEWEETGLDDGNSLDYSGGTLSRKTGKLEAESAFCDDDILLAKEANEEQLQIIRKLERSGSVIVQGPPGTGKTHTIGNLIGHLLAQGKSILVTAQTTKALRVVRDQIPDMLRPLAVSVLGSDQTARQQLESAISSITERLTGDSADSLLKKSQGFEAERKQLLAQSKELSQKLRQALENEYREIKVGNKIFSPSDAARFISNHQKAHDWIPTPVKIGVDLILSAQELIRLYSLGTYFTPSEERDARKPLPELSALPSERHFKVMVSEYQDLTTTDLTFGADRWKHLGKSSESLSSLAAEFATEFSDDLRRQSWRPYAIVAGIHGGTEREVWEKLISQISETAEAHSKYSLVLHHQPRMSETLSVYQQHKIVGEICEHMNTGGKLGLIQLATRSEWRQFIKTSSVSAGQPTHPDHFDALKHLTDLTNCRNGLQPLWDELIGKHIQQPFNSLGTSPEQSCRALIPEILRCLDWHDKVWMPLKERIISEGLKVGDIVATLPREATQVSEYKIIELLASTVMPPLILSEIGRRKLAECEAGFEKIESLALQVDPTSPDSGCIGQIISALRSRRPEAYEVGIEYARRLHIVKPLVLERDDLLKKLGLVAPVWAENIAHRIEPHHQSAVPGDVTVAWVWRQLHSELSERDKLNPHELQRQIDKIDETLRQVTQWLIDSKAWGKQLERLERDNSIRQALVGWLDTTKRLISTRQLDKRHTLLAEARKLMKRCAEAVPVWVMPINIMAENFDPRTTRFDVVIIDEASQADLNALIPLYLGKQVIIVGDHEQVTPLGVGKGQTILENLRKQMLEDIPNSHLFDHMSSIYDIARQSFGDAIRLVEHFRCVPEIIAFSNQLSYDGKIRPLRESNSTDLKPACISCQVEGVRDGDTNNAEARRIVDTIKAMIEHPKYADKTIGVISMIGDAQSILIQSLLHKELSGTEIEKRRIQAGNSSEFQGDERDVIFLSMIDSPAAEGQLRTTGEGAFELIKKRYNVATSRARDQLWVIHSFDPDLHLKHGDIRLKLLQHVKDPLASLRAFNQAVGKTESPFERSVLKLLTDAGYRVVTQWQVGYYRIDMVVEGGGKRLAVECDGDRYHPMEKLADDMERQTVLERLGWQFVRIRGSAFYRDADAAMHSVFSRLEELDIPKEANLDLPDISDMSLLHELDDIIRVGFGNDLEGSNGGSEDSTNDVEPQEKNHPIDMSSVSHSARLMEYKEYEFAGGPAEQFYSAENRSVLRSQLLCIIDAESPIADFVLFRRIARAWNLARTGNRIETLLRSLVPKDLPTTKDNGSVFYWPKTICASDWNGFRVAGSDPESKRSLDEISLEEIGNLCLHILAEQVSIQLGDLARSVSRYQGIGRTSSDAEERVLKALKHGRVGNAVSIEAGIVKAKSKVA